MPPRIDYNSTACIDATILIREIKKHKILYDKTVRQNDKVVRQPIWEEIYRVLFPSFDSLSRFTQDTIRKTAQKRWKTLRDCLVRSVRVRKRSNSKRVLSPQMQSLDFLIPYLRERKRRNAKGNDEASSSQTIENGDSSCADANDDIISIKTDDEESILSSEEFFGLDGPMPKPELEVKAETIAAVTQDNICEPELNIKPEIKIQTNDESIYVASDTETLPQMECHSTFIDAGSLPMNVESQGIVEPPNHSIQNLSNVPNLSNLQRSYLKEDIDYTVLDLLQQSAMDSKDEDRMFLLSILSDFKSVPPHKKLKVKARIVEAIAGALD